MTELVVKRRYRIRSKFKTDGNGGLGAGRQGFNRSGSRPAFLCGVPLCLAWQLRRNVARVLLPKGFPHSVTENYLAYVQWASVGMVSGRVQSVLATQAALFAIGLGAGSIPMAAAMQWVLKDGIGHAGVLVYICVLFV